MTLLASEATKESRALLKKHKLPDAKNYADLEIKLAEIYRSTGDKFALEKELAEIHPHKDWLIRRLELERKKDIKPVIEEMVVPEKKEQQQVCTNPYCPIHGCSYSNANGMANNPYATVQGKPASALEAKGLKGPSDYIGIIGVLAMAGMVFFVLTKTTK